MAHCIQAFVATPAVARRITRRFSRAVVVDLTSQLALVPLSGALREAVTVDPFGHTFGPFTVLHEAMLEAVLAAVGDEQVGYLETEYFGGEGSQAAAVWVNGQPALRPLQDTDSINQLLAMFGVTSAGGTDAFNSVGLHRFRSMDAFTE